MTASEARTPAQEMVTTQTAGEHDALVAAMQRLERALAAAAPGREADWAHRVVGDLRAVRRELEQHRETTEGPDGLFVEIRRAIPGAAYRLEKLREAHAAMLEEADALLASAERMEAAASGSVDAIRRRVSALLSALRAHQAKEVDLIYEAFDRDIGAPD